MVRPQHLKPPRCAGPLRFRPGGTHSTPKALHNTAQGRAIAPWVGVRHPRSANPNGVLQTAGRRHGIRIPKPKRLSNRATAPVSNPVGVRVGSVGRIVFPGCAIATLGFDVEPLRG